jgi:predicted dehydrogenase
VPRVRFGVIGAAWIADRALIPALRAARNATCVAIASRDPGRARALAQRHGITTVHRDYDALIADDQVDAVYLALVNSLHLPWTLRALAAGKHVLCEKPLSTTAAEAREMAGAAETFDRTLMEALMYRFHPRMVELRRSASGVHHLHAAFAFVLPPGDDYRWDSRLGGGVLLDTGCYTLDVARWFLGEPSDVAAVMTGDGVETTVAAALRFPSGSTATTWVSFASPEHQVLELTCADGSRRIERPFTAWRDPHDPYQLMVEAFADSVLSRAPPPRTLAESIATAELLDRVRAAAFKS